MIFPERTVMRHFYFFSCLPFLMLGQSCQVAVWAPVLSFLQPGPGSVAGVLWITHRQIKREIHRWFTWMSDFEKLTFKWASPHQLSHLPLQKNLNKTEWSSRSKEGFIEADLKDFHQLTIYFQYACDHSMDFLLHVFSHHTSGFVKTCACHYRALRVETVRFDIPLLVFASFCSLCTNVFHCGMLSSFAGLKNHSVFELFA